MQAPDITYRYIYPKDIAGPTFEIATRRGTTVLNNAVINVDILGVPQDRCLVFQNAAIVANPGALIQVLDIQILGITSAGQVFIISNLETKDPTDAEDVSHNWSGAVYLLGQGVDVPSLRMHVRFDGADAANEMTFGLHGVVIPRGNIAPF